MNIVGRYIRNNLRAWDRALNALLFGDDHDTVSGRVGRVAQQHGGTIPWDRPISKVLHWVLNGIETDHCEKANHDSDGNDGILDRSAGPLPHEEPPKLYVGGTDQYTGGES